MANATKQQTKFKQITQADFDTIKKLQELGLKAKMIQDITKRGTGTVWSIMHSETMEDYVNLRRRSYDLKLQKRQTVVAEQLEERIEEQQPVIDTLQTPTDSELITVLNKINDTLVQLVDAWNTQPEQDKPRRNLFR